MARKKKDPAVAVEVSPGPKYDGSLDSLARLVRVENETLEEARRRVIALVAEEQDDEMRKFCLIGQRNGRPHQTLDELAATYRIPPSKIVAALAKQLHERQMATSTIIAALASPKVTARLAQRAMESESELPTVKGDRARDTFLRVTGQLRSGSNGGGTRVNVVQTNNNRAGAQAVAGIPKFEDRCKTIAASVEEGEAES